MSNQKQAEAWLSLNSYSLCGLNPALFFSESQFLPVSFLYSCPSKEYRHGPCVGADTSHVPVPRELPPCIFHDPRKYTESTHFSQLKKKKGLASLPTWVPGFHIRKLASGVRWMIAVLLLASVSSSENRANNPCSASLAGLLRDSDEIMLWEVQSAGDVWVCYELRLGWREGRLRPWR